MEKIVSGEVISLHGYVVFVETDIALPGNVVVHTVLPFGPFPSLEGAEVWANVVMALRAEHMSAEAERTMEFDEATGLPTAPYVDLHAVVHMIDKAKNSRKHRADLFAPETPEIAEGKLAYYALNTVREAVTHSCTLVEP